MGLGQDRIDVCVAHLGLKDYYWARNGEKRIGIPSFGRQTILLCSLAVKTAGSVLLH